MSNARVVNADCLTALRDMPDASVDAVVTDPPYGLSNTTPTQVADTITRWVSGDREYLPTGRGFMGHEWDGFVPPVAVWDECLRVLKPGGHLLAFAGSRTHDLMTLGIRLAGFDIRDSVAWLYGSGFPKSLDVSKAIESHTLNGKSNSRTLRKTEQDGDGEAYTLTGKNNGIMGEARTYDRKTFAPTTDAARQWEGWGTALKPAFEPVTLARKPLTGTVAANVLEHGTGALNIDGCRVGTEIRVNPAGGAIANPLAYGKRNGGQESTVVGRWPANVVLDESQAAELDRQSGNVKSGGNSKRHKRASPNWGGYSGGSGIVSGAECPPSEGGASRFFKVIEHDAPFMYCAKAPKSERPVVDGVAHSTVKPVTLMRWLVRMVTPPGGVVLDPFAGSGTTLEAAMLEGFNVTGIEREADYLPLIQARIDRATAELAARAEAEADTLFPIDGAAS